MKKDKLELQLRQKQIEVMTRGLSKKLAAVFLSFTLLFSSGAAVFAGESISMPISDDAVQVQQPAEITDKKPVTISRPVISARSAVVIDGDTGEILYTKNSHYKRDPLSTTKLLTCLVALEYLKTTETVTVTKAAVDTAAKVGGSSAGLKVGEKVKVKDLVYGALLPSGNDAAAALAIAVSGSKVKFAKLMNRKAGELGCKDSNFTNPHGWKAKQHYASAYDMALITKAAMQNSLIKKACSTEMYKMARTNKHKARWISTTNSFVAKKKYPKSGVYAGKTGTWEYNNAALVSVCERDGKTTYAVVLRDTMDNRWKSTNQILNYSYKKLNQRQDYLD
ncbi:D-alanyl-D-alanine carboxypeptidase family protein [Ihubacter sp. rT4E-8]|uniref:D-alanyl-D-alanine carboxypeptidase family protein n=1 Tax=Ihubacter sp. rT4E-8 TaxID=3242369 RepID=UPI003CE6D37C